METKAQVKQRLLEMERLTTEEEQLLFLKNIKSVTDFHVLLGLSNSDIIKCFSKIRLDYNHKKKIHNKYVGKIYIVDFSGDDTDKQPKTIGNSSGIKMNWGNGDDEWLYFMPFVKNV